MTGWPCGSAIESDAPEGPCQKLRSRIEHVQGSKRMRVAKLVRPLDWPFRHQRPVKRTCGATIDLKKVHVPDLPQRFNILCFMRICTSPVRQKHDSIVAPWLARRTGNKVLSFRGEGVGVPDQMKQACEHKATDRVIKGWSHAFRRTVASDRNIV
jgi:hypothetical protein